MVIYKLFLIFIISNVIYVGPKKTSLVSRIGRLKNFCYHLPGGISRMCMRIYIFCFKKTNKKISTSKFIRTNLLFFPSNNKRKKSAKEKFC